MEINTEENLIDLGRSIKNDIDLLNSMGFDKTMINKVYILLRPVNIERAFDYMTEINGIYQHEFLFNPNEHNSCFICKKPSQNHINNAYNILINDTQNGSYDLFNGTQNNFQYYISNDLINEGKNNNIFNNLQNMGENIYGNEIHSNNKINGGGDELKIFDECGVCYEEINNDDITLNLIPCGHLFCSNCWFNYLKTLISEAKVENIKCMNHFCKEIISEDFILKHISANEDLMEKYEKFKKRAEIINDKNKKLCPKPDCDSFLEKSNSSKYVKCEKGHEYCFECLRPPHGDKLCSEIEEKQFMKWKKDKRVKRCPKCQIYTEKNEGCNHMTCTNCQYQWCWLCEEEYNYEHYKFGKCNGQQFTKIDNLKDIEYVRHAFGLHKIFKCVYPNINGLLIFDFHIGLKYIIMLLFWIFGYAGIFLYVELTYFTKHDIIEYTFNRILILPLGLALFICFQFSFSCLVAPFILISLFNHHFFERILFFLGIGEFNSD